MSLQDKIKWFQKSSSLLEYNFVPRAKYFRWKRTCSEDMDGEWRTSVRELDDAPVEGETREGGDEVRVTAGVAERRVTDDAEVGRTNIDECCRSIYCAANNTVSRGCVAVCKKNWWIQIRC